MKSARQPGALLAAAVALAALLVFWPARDFGFVTYDDPSYVSGNDHVLGGVHREGIRWAFTTSHTSNWHPLTWLSLMLDAELYGAGPRGFHATAVWIHAANAVLLFLLLARMTGEPGRSAFVAALFAVHPLHVESVAWVSSRKDLLSTLFGLLSLLAWLSYVRGGGRSRYALSLAAYGLSLLSKQMLVTLPFLLVLLDLWPLRRSGPARVGRLLPEKIPFFALAAALSVVAVWAQHAGGALRDMRQFPLAGRLANAATAYVLYAWKTLVPVKLAAFYPYPASIPAWQVAGAVAILAAVTIAVVVRLPRQPYLAVGWLWYVGTLVPVIGLVQIGAQQMADRYTYIPIVGLFAAGTWLVASAVPRGRWLLPAAAVVVLLALGVTARVQLMHWRDSQSLFTRAVAVTEKNAVAHNNLGTLHGQAGRIDEALGEFRKAAAADPTFAGPHGNIGFALLQLGRPAEAEIEFREALRLDPRFVAARMNYGLLLERAGRHVEALEQYDRALDADADNAALRRDVAAARERLGRVR